LFGTENEGFPPVPERAGCTLMKSFFGCIRLWRTEAKNGEIRVQNAKFAGKIITQDEFNAMKRGISSFQEIPRASG